MTTLVTFAIGIGLNYLPISKSRLMFIVCEFLGGGGLWS